MEEFSHLFPMFFRIFIEMLLVSSSLKPNLKNILGSKSRYIQKNI
jgi:hypothetical protein